MCPVCQTGQVGCGKAIAQRVKPHGRGPGQDSYTVMRPYRIPVAQPFGVVPHAVGIDQMAPASCAMSIILPSTWNEMLATIVSGGLPNRSTGQLRLIA